MTTINAETLQKMFIAGAKNLEAKKEWINELNVFPVPDGDTGTNMTLTIMSAAKEVGAITEPTMETIAKAISTGSLRGARGNSGVILSQLFRGFTREIKKVDQIDVDVLSRACVKAVETAYKAVMKPKEGTILTVAKGMADKSCELVGESDDLVHVIDEIIKHGDYVLSQTPEMLPVLKQAGVVDSGGQGLMTVIKGAFDALLGKEIDYTLEPVQTAGTKVTEEVPMDDVEIKFGYCTEFIINLDKEMPKSEEKAFKGPIQAIMEYDLGVFGVDEIFGLDIARLYGAIGQTNFGDIDVNKPGVVAKLNEEGKMGSKHCHTFLDDIVGAIAAAASTRVAQIWSEDEAIRNK